MELKNLGQTAASALIHTDIRLEREHWTMFRNKIFGIAAAATLGTAAMLGTNAANAIDIGDGSSSVTAALSYAKETLAEKLQIAAKDTKYYTLTEVGTNHNVTFEAPVGAQTGQTTYATITLSGGLAFHSQLGTDALSPGFALVAGGGPGENTVVFSSTAQITKDSDVTLDAQFVTDGSASGMIAIDWLNETLDRLPNFSGAGSIPATKIVSVVSGLAETAMAANLTATVASGFKSFKDTRSGAASDATVQLASLGTLQISLAGESTATTPLAAGDGANSEVADIYAAATSMVTASGDFSFAKAASWQRTAACATISAAADLLQMDADGNVKSDLKAVAVGSISDGAPGASDHAPDANATEGNTANLCIELRAAKHDEAVPVPSVTEPYTVTIAYKAGTTNAAFDPMGTGPHSLGTIMRDGTTVHLPYLSTNDKFNQRIRMVNRSSSEAKYEMSFHGDGDVGGMDASGMLPAKSITVLSLRTDDVVEPGNGNNTSGTLIVEATANMIDVASVQINRETGNSDTVVYSAE